MTEQIPQSAVTRWGTAPSSCNCSTAVMPRPTRAICWPTSGPAFGCWTSAVDPEPSRSDWLRLCIPARSTASTWRSRQIELARAAAVDGGHDNTIFHVGNVYELPFEDGYFDAAHCHAVLMHVPDTQRALREVSRVLKPGGIIASREMIGSCSFNEPMGETTGEAWDTFIRMLAANGGHPEMGRELKSHLLRAGSRTFAPVALLISSAPTPTWHSCTPSSATGSSRQESLPPRRSTGWRRGRISTGGGLKSTSGGMNPGPWAVWHSARLPE